MVPVCTAPKFRLLELAETAPGAAPVPDSDIDIVEFGAFVELFPGTDGLLHISEIAEHRVRDGRDELKLGDQVMVKVLAIEGNKIRLSRKALIKEAREKAQKSKEAAAGAAAPAAAEVAADDPPSAE